MKNIRWDHKKNLWLQKTRGVSFEEVVEQLQSDGPLDVRRHPNQERYPHQRIFVLAMKDYVYLVPFVEDEESIILKTVIPSRKAKKELGR